MYKIAIAHRSGWLVFSGWKFRKKSSIFMRFGYRVGPVMFYNERTKWR